MTREQSGCATMPLLAEEGRGGRGEAQQLKQENRIVGG